MTLRFILYIFRTTFVLFIDAVPLNNGSLQIPAYSQTLSLRLTKQIVNLRTHHVPRWNCQQLWFHCQHTAAQVGLLSSPTDKALKSCQQWRLLGLFGGWTSSIKVRHPDHNACPNINCWKFWVGERNHFLRLMFLTRFCTFLLNVDSILSYTEVASDFQSKTLTVFTVTSTNSLNKLVTHWTLVSAWWLLTNRTVSILSFLSTVSSEVSLVWFSSSTFLTCWLVSIIIHSCVKELFQFFSLRWRARVFSEWRIPKSDPLLHSKRSLIRACLDAWMQSLVFPALDKP